MIWVSILSSNLHQTHPGGKQTLRLGGTKKQSCLLSFDEVNSDVKAKNWAEGNCAKIRCLNPNGFCVFFCSPMRGNLIPLLLLSHPLPLFDHASVARAGAGSSRLRFGSFRLYVWEPGTKWGIWGDGLKLRSLFYVLVLPRRVLSANIAQFWAKFALRLTRAGKQLFYIVGRDTKREE